MMTNGRDAVGYSARKDSNLCSFPRRWKISLPYFSIVGTIIATMATLMISYYMVYRGNQNLGLCFIEKYPGIRQACLLDMTSGVMGTILGVLFLFVECATAQIKQQDWRTVFCAIKICSATITAAMLVAGTIQGIVAFADFCDGNKYHYNNNVEYLYYLKNCYLSSAKHTVGDEADFVTIVTLSGVATLWWIVLLLIEIIRTCLVHPERPNGFKYTSKVNI